MRMPRILQKDASALRTVAREVPIKDIRNPRVKRIIEEMRAALDGEADGVALAAPQIGETLRIFVVSPKAFKKNTATEKEHEPDTKEVKKNPNENLVYINPVIIKLSKKKDELAEGCLSVHHMYGRVARSTKATVRAYNERGELFERGGSGLLAQIFQHEIDHLDGVLFTDKAVDVEEVQTESLKEL